MARLQIQNCSRGRSFSQPGLAIDSRKVRQYPADGSERDQIFILLELTGFHDRMTWYFREGNRANLYG
jgi:hypothetical protein